MFFFFLRFSALKLRCDCFLSLQSHRAVNGPHSWLSRKRLLACYLSQSLQNSAKARVKLANKNKSFRSRVLTYLYPSPVYSPSCSSSPSFFERNQRTLVMPLKDKPKSCDETPRKENTRVDKESAKYMQSLFNFVKWQVKKQEVKSPLRGLT